VDAQKLGGDGKRGGSKLPAAAFEIRNKGVQRIKEGETVEGRETS